jgi:hypothetical protein
LNGLDTFPAIEPSVREEVGNEFSEKGLVF